MNLPAHWPVQTDWTPHLQPHFNLPEFQSLCEFVATERAQQTIYPIPENVFSAFRLTPLSETKVVILGQDPYHGPDQAHGLSFSVEGEMKLPPSLRNIYKELQSDLGIDQPKHGNLTSWAHQGVFLLNTVLTVRQGQANSHRKKGWEQFTNEVIEQLSSQGNRIVFILWGKPAEKKAKLIDQERHAIIKSVHPSPLSAYRGFFGSQPFSQANAALRKFQRQEVDWSIA
ncbi:MAG: uracil-DNA glycosylase [Mariniblastus sp.]|nr:uracil-DNA glycosylase [Mariniblastus sp.]